MQKITFKGDELKIKKRVHDGLEIFQVEWPDYSLDFLYREKKVWKSLTILPAKHINKLGLEIEKLIN